jgi:hypothetical protein
MNYFRHSARISLAEKPQPAFMFHATVQWGLDRHMNTPILQSPNPNRMLPLPPRRRPSQPSATTNAAGHAAPSCLLDKRIYHFTILYTYLYLRSAIFSF